MAPDLPITRLKPGVFLGGTVTATTGFLTDFGCCYCNRLTDREAEADILAESTLDFLADFAGAGVFLVDLAVAGVFSACILKILLI